MITPGHLKHPSIISITLVIIYLYLLWYYIFLVLAPEGSLIAMGSLELFETMQIKKSTLKRKKIKKVEH